MRRFIVLVLLGLVTETAHAGSYTVTTTPEQDQALARIASKRNATAQRSHQSPPTPMTPQQVVQEAVDAYVSATVIATRREAACAKVTDAQAKAALGCAPATK